MRARLSLALLFVAVAALLVVFGVSQAPRAAIAADNTDKGIVASLLSRALSSDTSSVSIGAVDGALSSDITIHDVVISDANGPWLKLDKARLVWSQLALLQRRLQVNSLEIGRLEMLRRPLPSPKPAADGGPILPDLPLKVVIDKFNADRIVLGQPLFGVAAELNASGKATLGPPSEGLDLAIDAKRLDAQGAFDLRLLFVPQSAHLTVNAKFDEAPGGLVSHIVNLPGEPPVHLSFDGDGPLDGFGAKLNFAAGPEIGANGEVHLARQGAGRHLTAAMHSRVAGLLPPVVSDVFAGETDLDMALGLGDDGAVAIDKLTLASQTAQLDVTGGVDAARNVAIALHAKALPGAPRIGSFTLDAEGNGPADAIALNVTSQVRDAKFSAGRLGALDAAFHVRPSGPFGDAATRIALDGEAKASGLALDDPRYADAFGPSAQLKFGGEATSDGVLHDAKLDWTTERLNAAFAGEVSAKHVLGKASLTAPDLTPFARLAGLALKGALEAKVDVDATPRDGAVRAAIDAEATKFAAGKREIDGFADGSLKLKGVAKRLADGGFGFETLRLEGAHGVALVDGQVSTQKAALRATIDIPEVKTLDDRVSGRAHVGADLTGTLDRLDGAVLATLQDGRLLGRPTPRLQVTADLHDLTGLPNGELKLDGQIDATPAKGDIRLAQHDDGAIAIDALSLAIGTARIDGQLTLAADRRAVGHLAVVAPKLDDLSPLVLTKLSGALEAQADLSVALDQQNAALRATSAALSGAGVEVSGLDVDIRAKDIFGAPLLSGRADVARLVAGGEAITGLDLKATSAAKGSDVALRLRARGLDVQAQGLLAAGAPQFTLSTLTADGNGQRVRLLKPNTVSWGGGGANLGEFSLGVGSGRATVSGHIGPTLDLQAAISALPLSAVDLAKPGLGLAGTLDAEAKIHGAPDALQGNWRASVAGLTAPQTRSSGLPPIAAKASGALGGGRTTIDATVDLARQSTLRITGSAPLSAAGALDLRAAGKVDLAVANSLLGASGQRATGIADINMGLQGPAAQPRAAGTIVLRGGAFSDETSGFKANAIEATLTANGTAIDVTRFRATTPNGGTLSASGNIRLDPAAGFPGAIRLTAQNAQLVSNDIVSATADVALDVSGALARSPKVSGRVGISSMDIQIPGRLPSQAVPLADARHVDPGPTARARLAIAAKAQAQRVAGRPFVATLDLSVSAPNRIFVRGRGVDAELSGDMTITGTTTRPSTTGGFQLRRGTFSILGKTLDFTRGTATFHGDVIPDLDMLAETNAGGIAAKIEIAGSAAKPTFTFSSTPALAQDEILSRMLFEKASGALSPVQALQLANAASSLAGGPDQFERIRRSLGVDSLDIGSDSNGGSMVGVRRNLGNRLSVGVTTGVAPEDNGVSLDFDLTKNIRLQGGVNAAGGSTMGAGYQYEYDLKPSPK